LSDTLCIASRKKNPDSTWYNSREEGKPLTRGTGYRTDGHKGSGKRAGRKKGRSLENCFGKKKRNCITPTEKADKNRQSFFTHKSLKREAGGRARKISIKHVASRCSLTKRGGKSTENKGNFGSFNRPSSCFSGKDSASLRESRSEREKKLTCEGEEKPPQPKLRRRGDNGCFAKLKLD